MTTPDETVEGLARVLGEHYLAGWIGRGGFVEGFSVSGPVSYHYECSCGEEVPTSGHRTHVATILAAYVAEREAAVLREAADEVDAGPTFPLPPSVIAELLRERAGRVGGWS